MTTCRSNACSGCKCGVHDGPWVEPDLFQPLSSFTRSELDHPELSDCEVLFLVLLASQSIEFGGYDRVFSRACESVGREQTLREPTLNGVEAVGDVADLLPFLRSGRIEERLGECDGSNTDITDDEKC